MIINHELTCQPIHIKTWLIFSKGPFLWGFQQPTASEEHPDLDIIAASLLSLAQSPTCF